MAEAKTRPTSHSVASYLDAIDAIDDAARSKACLCINRLDDVDLDALEQLLARSAAATKKRYPTTANATRG